MLLLSSELIFISLAWICHVPCSSFLPILSVLLVEIIFFLYEELNPFIISVSTSILLVLSGFVFFLEMPLFWLWLWKVFLLCLEFWTISYPLSLSLFGKVVFQFSIAPYRFSLPWLAAHLHLLILHTLVPYPGTHIFYVV